MKFILLVTISVSIAGCSSAPAIRGNDGSYEANLAKAKRLQATQAIARDRRFLGDLRSASNSEHAGLTDESILEKAKASMKVHSQDPDSVLFRNVVVSTTHGFRVVCGELSANNTGGNFHKFYWVSVYLSGVHRSTSPGGSLKEWQESEDTLAACPT